MQKKKKKKLKFLVTLVNTEIEDFSAELFDFN